MSDVGGDTRPDFRQIPDLWQRVAMYLATSSIIHDLCLVSRVTKSTVLDDEHTWALLIERDFVLSGPLRRWAENNRALSVRRSLASLLQDGDGDPPEMQSEQERLLPKAFYVYLHHGHTPRTLRHSNRYLGWYQRTLQRRDAVGQCYEALHLVGYRQVVSRLVRGTGLDFLFGVMAGAADRYPMRCSMFSRLDSKARKEKNKRGEHPQPSSRHGQHQQRSSSIVTDDDVEFCLPWEDSNVAFRPLVSHGMYRRRAERVLAWEGLNNEEQERIAEADDFRYARSTPADNNARHEIENAMKHLVEARKRLFLNDQSQATNDEKRNQMLAHQDLRWKSLCSSYRIIESSVAWTTTISCEFQRLVEQLEWFSSTRSLLLITLCTFNPLAILQKAVTFVFEDTPRFAEVWTQYSEVAGPYPFRLVFGGDNLSWTHLRQFLLDSVTSKTFFNTVSPTLALVCLRPLLCDVAQGMAYPALLSVGKRPSVVAFRVLAALLDSSMVIPVAHVVLPALWRFESLWLRVAIPVLLLYPSMTEMIRRRRLPEKHQRRKVLIQWAIACLLFYFGGRLLSCLHESILPLVHDGMLDIDRTTESGAAMPLPTFVQRSYLLCQGLRMFAFAIARIHLTDTLSPFQRFTDWYLPAFRDPLIGSYLPDEPPVAEAVPSDGAQGQQQNNVKSIDSLWSRFSRWLRKSRKPFYFNGWLHTCDEAALGMIELLVYMNTESVALCFLARFGLKVAQIATSFALSKVCS